MTYIHQLTQNLTAIQLQDLMSYIWTSGANSHQIPAAIKAWRRRNNIAD